MKRNWKITKKVKWLIKGIALFFIALFAGYHMYCHYMVKKFYRYIDAGDWEAALVQVEKMPDVNMVDMCSPLYCLSDILLQGAASEGVPLERAIYKHAPVSIFEALLEKGADPDKKAPRGILTPFQYLCNHYETGEKDEKIELMVQHGADISSVILPIPGWFQMVSEQERESAFRYISFLWENGVTDRMYVGTKYECTVLHSAARMLDAEYLSRLYHDEKREMDYLLNEKDIYGETPLFFAVRENEPDNCAFLINEGADMDIKNNEGKTAYDVAVELGNEACMALLGQGGAADYIFYLEDEGVRENPVFAAFINKEITACDAETEENRYIYECYEHYKDGIYGVHYMAEDLDGDGEDELLVLLQWDGCDGDLLVFHEEDGKLYQWETWKYFMWMRMLEIAYYGNGIFSKGGGAGAIVGRYNAEGKIEYIVEWLRDFEYNEEGKVLESHHLILYKDGQEEKELRWEGIYSCDDDTWEMTPENLANKDEFAAIMHEIWEELGEGREIRNVEYEEDVQKIPPADVVRTNREQDKECAEAYFYLLEGEWVAGDGEDAD